MGPRVMNRYQQRLRHVVRYIEEHLMEKISVEQLSQVACLSKFHFHRWFSACMGVAVYQYIQRLRLKRASYQLVYRKDLSVTDVAFDNGYENSESLARAFKKNFGQTPLEFRKQADWASWHLFYQTLEINRSKLMQHNKHSVQLVEFEPTAIAAVEHRGSPHHIAASISDLIAWRKQHRLPPAKSRTFNILYNDPEEVEATDYRMDIAAECGFTVEENVYGVVGKVIPGGLCAVLRHQGPDELLADKVRYLYTQWLHESGYELRDFPIFLERVTLFPEVTADAIITDIYVPIR